MDQLTHSAHGVGANAAHHPDRSATSRARGRDVGFTLVEIVMAIVLSSIVGSVLVAALMTSLNAVDSTSSTVANSIDTQLISSFLAVDAQAAGGIDPSTARQLPDLGVSTIDDATGWSACEQRGTLVVRFAWIDRSASDASKVVVTYALSPDGSFVRRVCEPSGDTEAVLGRSVNSARVSCDPLASCMGLPDQLTLTLAGGDTRTPFEVTLNASLRPEIQDLPTSLNSAEVPLLVIGDATCPVLSRLGVGTTHVLGDAVVDAACGASPIVGDLSLFDVVGATSVLPSVNDPFVDLAAPAACPASGANPTIGSSTGPDSVTVYPSTVTISTSVAFEPGRHVFCDGLAITGGAIVRGAGVLLYIGNGSVDVAATSTVSISAATTGDYAGLALWSASPKSVSIESGASVHDIRGAVYVPAAGIDLVSAAGIRLGAVVADRVSIDGTGPVRLGSPSPTLSVAATQLPSAFTLQSYSATAPAISGGTAPYRFTATGLPLGLVMNSSGAITGVPLSSGTATVSFLAIDATGASVPFTRTIAVSGVPPVPVNLVATPGDGSAAITWSAGASSGAPATSIYTVTATATGAATQTCTVTAPTTSCTMTLANGRAYSISVTATNSIGTSPAATAAVTPRPASLTAVGNVLWLDAADPDADGTSEGTAEQCSPTATCSSAANVLTRWEDKSGSNNDATQATSTMAGSFVAGMPAVNFDSNGFYEATVTSGPDLTVFVVAQSDTSDWNTWGWLLSARRPNGVLIHPYPPGKGVSWHAVNAAGAHQASATVTIADTMVPHIYDLTEAGSNPIVANGSLDGNTVLPTTSYAGQTRAATSVTMKLGADDCCGTRYGNGKYREVIVFNRALTPAERRSVQEYLARKWGIAVTPGAPTAVSALAADAGALVSWTAPTSDGGSAITGYRVTAWPGGATCTAAATGTSCAVLGLTNGTAYAFFVEALNAVGTGVQSAQTNTITPGPPPAPTALSVVAGDGQVDVSWTAPVLNGHAPLLSYTATATATGQTTRTCTVSAPTTTCRLSPLTNHVQYSLSVVATNAHGNSPAATTTVTPTWNPTALGSALTLWYDASVSTSLTGSWVTQSTFTVSGAAGSNRVQASSGIVERVDVIAGGTGYTSSPDLTFTGGGGSGAVAGGLTVTSGSLSLPNLWVRGSGYTSEPTVSASGGGGTGATLRARIMAPVTVGATLRIAGQSYTVTDRDGLTLTITPPLAATATAAAVEEWQVSRWNNLAGAGVRDARQTAAAQQPVLGTMAGRGATVFSGIDNFMWILDDAQSNRFDHGPNWTVLVAYQADRQVSWGSVAQPWAAINSRILSTSSATIADWHSGENVAVYPDVASDSVTGGPVRIATANGNGADTADWTRAFIGAIAGPGYQDGWSFSGRIGEIIFVNDGLDSATVAKAQAYLADKWAQPASTPSAPVAVTPTPGDAQVALSWRAANEFTSPVTGYTATATAFGQTTRTCTSTTVAGCTITGLVNGAVYSVTVTATNATGTGPTSVPVTVVTRPALLVGSSSRLWLDGADLDGDGWVEGGPIESGIAAGRVQTWNDKSGRANHTSAPTTATRPTAATQTMNGLPVIAFDGTTTLQGASAANPYGITGDRTMFVVTRRRSGSPSRLIDRSPEDNPLFSITGTNTLEVRDDANGQYQASIGTNPSAVNTGYIIEANRSGTALGIRSNGVSSGSGTITGTQTMRAITVGRHVAYGATADVDVAEVLLFDRVLTAAERRQVEEYLQLKWAIAITPAAPTGVTPAQSNGTVTVSWTAPTSNGGSPITGYTVTASPGGATCTSTGTSCTMNGLLTGSTYTFSVSATNAVGTSSAAVSTSLTVAPLTIASPGADGIISDGTSLWVTNATTATVSRIDPVSTKVLATIAVGRDPTQLAFDGTYVWVTNYSSNTVSKIDPSTNTVVATVAVGASPVGIAYDGRSIWVANFFGGSLSRIDPSTDAVTETVNVGQYPRHLTFAHGSIWYGRLYDARVGRLDPSTGTTTASIAVATAPYDIVSDGTSVWVASYEGAAVTKIDPATNTVLATVSPGARSYGLVHASGRMWVTMPLAGTIRSIDTTTNALGPSIAVGNTPFSVVATGAGPSGPLWVANYGSNTVARIVI